jgi:hypothetical protein
MNLSDARSTTVDFWPALPYAEWKDTLDTVHMWTQIVGKVKLQFAPFLNDWWQVAFAVTARGLTTSTIPNARRMFQVDLDFVDHRLDIHVSDGRSRSFSLYPRSVADFYLEFTSVLQSLGIHATINTTPVEVENIIPLNEDGEHASYDRDAVSRWWRILVQVDRVLQGYRTPFIGKSSQVNFWWGSFDLSETRYSGRPAPEHPRPARWMELSAPQEQAAAGFWPGNAVVREPAFFAYVSPEPAGCREATLQPDAAMYHPDLSEFILPYEAVRTAHSPDRMLMDFFESTYAVESTLAKWDRRTLERPDPTRPSP